MKGGVINYECPRNECEFIEMDTTDGHFQRFVTSLVVLSRPTESDYMKVLLVGAYGYETTRKSNHLQTPEQRKHFLLSFLKTLSVGPARV